MGRRKKLSSDNGTSAFGTEKRKLDRKGVNKEVEVLMLLSYE